MEMCCQFRGIKVSCTYGGEPRAEIIVRYSSFSFVEPFYDLFYFTALKSKWCYIQHTLLET